MIPPALAIVLVLGVLGVILLSTRVAAKRWEWHPELQRKAVHIGMGATVLSFPWLFQSLIPVFILASLAVAILACARSIPSLRKGAGSPLYSVERDSHGEIYFTVSVALLYWLSGGDPVQFCVPVLILTLADAAGALIGVRYGKLAYTTLSGTKSAEGSVTCFTVSFFAAHVPLLLATNLGRAEALLIAVCLAALCMLVEAVATRGLDNLVIPLGAWFLLVRLSELDAVTLAGRAGLLLALLVTVLTLRGHSSLEGGALLGAVLFAYGCRALGDWLFLSVVVILFVDHLIAVRAIREVASPRHNLYGILSVATTSLPWLVLFYIEKLPRDQALYAFTANVAAHFAIFNRNTLLILSESLRPTQCLLRCPLKALLCFIPLLLFPPASLGIAFVMAGVTFILGSAALVVFGCVFSCPPKENQMESARRWMLQAVICLVVSGAAYGVARWF
jgi:phytol kinase